MQEYMKIWMGEKVVGSVGTDGTILDAASQMVGHIYLYTGEVSLGDAVAGDAVVGSISHEGDIYDDNGKVGDIARSGNIWDAQGNKVGWVAPLQYWKSAIALYESYDAPLLLAGGAALLLVLRPTAEVALADAVATADPAHRMYPPTIPLSSYGFHTTISLAYI